MVSLFLSGCLTDHPKVELEGVQSDCMNFSGKYFYSEASCEGDAKNSDYHSRPFKAYLFQQDSFSQDPMIRDGSILEVKQRSCESIQFNYQSVDHRHIVREVDLSKKSKYWQLQWSNRQFLLKYEKADTGCFFGCGYESKQMSTQMKIDENGDLLYFGGNQEWGLWFFLFPYSQDHTIHCKLKKE
jgi:hypothetical protein